MLSIVEKNMENFTYLLLIIFTIANFIIYHKIFDVYYFNLGKGIVKEIIGCLFVAVLEYALLVWIGGFILKALIVIAIIIVIIRIIMNVKDGKAEMDGWTVAKLVLCGVGLLIMLVPGLFDSVVDSIKESKDNKTEYTETNENSALSINDEGYEHNRILSDEKIDFYDYRLAEEKDILRVLGYEQNDSGIYPNEEEKVFACVDGKVFAIYITKDTEERYTFLDIQIGEHITSVTDKVSDYFTYAMAGDTFISEELLQVYYLDNEVRDGMMGGLQIFFDKDTYLIDSILFIAEVRVQDMPSNSIEIEGVTPMDEAEEVEEAGDFDEQMPVPEETEVKTDYEFTSWNESVEILAYLSFNSNFDGGSLRIDKTTYRGGGASSMYEYFLYTFKEDDENEGIYRIYDEYAGYQNMFFYITSEECLILNIYDEDTGNTESYLEKEYAYNNVG